MRVVLLSVAVAGACAEPAVGGDDGGDSSGAECGTTQCTDRLQLSLVALAGVFDGGSYVVVTEVENDASSCSFELASEASDCNGDPPCVLENDCEAEFGFAVLPHFIVLSVHPAPELVRLGIARDDTSLVDLTLAPEYADYYPNGSDCAPVCQMSSASIDLP